MHRKLRIGRFGQLFSANECLPPRLFISTQYNLQPKKNCKIFLISKRTFIYICALITEPAMRTRDEQKEKLIRAKALKMMVDEGFDGFSMQKLARVSGVSPATLYIYFKDREDLILQVYSEVNQRMTDATLKNFDPAMSFDEGLKIQWTNRAKYCLEHTREMHLMEQIRFSPLHEKALLCVDPHFKKTMKLFLQNAIDKKQLENIPFEVFWSVAYAPLYSLIKFHLTGKKKNGEDFVFTDKTMLHTLQLVLKSLKP